MFRPVVDPIVAILAVQESNLGQRTHKLSNLTVPIGSDLNVFDSHSLKATFWVIVTDPQEKNHKTAKSRRPESSLELHHLRVSR
jgi:hypothetical protein